MLFVFGAALPCFGHFVLCCAVPHHASWAVLRCAAPCFLGCAALRYPVISFEALAKLPRNSACTGSLLIWHDCKVVRLIAARALLLYALLCCPRLTL